MKAIKDVSKKIKNLKSKFNCDYLEEHKNDGLEIDKYQPNDRLLRMYLKFI